MTPPLWFANILAYWLQATLLVLAGGALPRLFRLRAPRILLAYWHALLVICAALPALQPWRAIASGPTTVEGAVSFDLKTVASGVAGVHTWFYSLVLAILLAGMVIRVGWLALGLGGIRRILRRARKFDPLPGWLRELELRLRVSPVWLLSPEVKSPATFGFRPSAILLPAQFPALNEASQRAIAGHEMLHVARRDWAFNVMEELALTAFWFHPGVAWVIGRIRLTREQVVDEEAVRLISPRKPYMNALLEMAAAGPGPLLRPAPTFLKERQLASRIELLVKEVTMSKVRLTLSLSAIAASMVLAGVISVRAFPLRAPTPATPAGIQTGDQAAPNSSPAANQPVKTVAPVYPPEAKKAGIQGEVKVLIRIDDDGGVSNVEMVSGPPQLTAAAIDAVKQWRFAPEEGARTTTITLNFTLAGNAKPAATSPAPDSSVTHPKVIYKIEPQYTKEAKAAKIQGTVILQIVIAADGSVSDVKVTKSLDKGLDANAVEAVKTWKFQPATKGGKPVAAKSTIEINFKLF